MGEKTVSSPQSSLCGRAVQPPPPHPRCIAALCAAMGISICFFEALPGGVTLIRCGQVGFLQAHDLNAVSVGKCYNVGVS